MPFFELTLKNFSVRYIDKWSFYFCLVFQISINQLIYWKMSITIMIMINHYCLCYSTYMHHMYIQWQCIQITSFLSAIALTHSTEYMNKHKHVFWCPWSDIYMDFFYKNNFFLCSHILMKIKVDFTRFLYMKYANT